MRCIFISLFFLVPFVGNSQCRYFDRIFTTVNKTSDISYGNAPAITAFYLGESITTAQDLKLDVFQPQGDAETNRALIIFAHSGGFINGSKSNDDMQALCDSFAHYGYVTATIEYRKNFNLLSSSSSERAVWRGIQDASTAIRYFKHNADVYNIDSNKIFLWGSSAGAFMALGLAYVDDAERPSSTFSSPNLGCKDCSGNNYSNTSKLAGIISCWGATKDTSWIQNNNNTPVQLFHGTADATVPITEGYPFGLSTITYVRGSQQLNEQLNRTSIYHEYYPAAGQDHEYWGTDNGTFVSTGPTAYWPDIINKGKLFMAGRMGAVPVCGPLPLSLTQFTGRLNGDKVNLYWSTASEFNMKNIIVERSMDGTAFSRLTDVKPRGNANNGSAYMITDYYPYAGTSFYRLRFVDTDGSILFSKQVSIETPGKEISISQLYPNPVSDLLKVQIQSDKFRKVNMSIMDITGRQVINGTVVLNLGINETRIPLSGLGSGTYIISYFNTEGNKLAWYKIVKL